MKTFKQFQEAAFAAPAIAGASKYVIPLLMTGIGAAGTILQARKNRGISKRKAKFLEKQLKDTPTQRTGGENFDTSGLDTDKLTPKEVKPKRITLRKGEVIQDEFSAPTNSMGGGAIAGSVEAGDDPPKKKKKKKTYAYGGRGSRKMWMNNK